MELVVRVMKFELHKEKPTKVKAVRTRLAVNYIARILCIFLLDKRKTGTGYLLHPGLRMLNPFHLSSSTTTKPLPHLNERYICI